MIAFAANTAAIYFGAQQTGIGKIGLGKALAVSTVHLVLWIVGAVVFSILLFPIRALAPFIFFNALFFAATALAARQVLEIEWEQAWTLGLIGMVVNLLVRLLLFSN
ncbi:MAG: hypothetical protein R3F46_00370 [bacterium]